MSNDAVSHENQMRAVAAIAADLSIELLADRPDGTLSRQHRERAQELVRELKALVRLVVHHIDGNPMNNDISNLRIEPR